MATVIKTKRTGRMRIKDVFHEVVSADTNVILNDLEESMEGITDIVVIGLDEDKLVFFGESGLMLEQEQAIMRVIITRYLED